MRVQNHHYGFEHFGPSDAKTAAGLPFGTLYVFSAKRDRDCWAFRPRRQESGGDNLRNAVKWRLAARLRRAGCPTVYWADVL